MVKMIPVEKEPASENVPPVICKPPLPPLGAVIVEPSATLKELLIPTVPLTMVEPAMVPPPESSSEPVLALLSVAAVLLSGKSIVVVPEPAVISSVPALLNAVG